MKILLTHAYFLEEDEREKKIMKPYPPLGILYISAWLKEHQIEHEVCDNTFSSSPAFEKYLLNYQPDVIGIYCNLMTKPNIVRLLDFLQSQPSLSHTKTVLGGPDVTYNLDDYLGCGANFAVVGEGEETFLELINHLKEGNNDADHIDGLAFMRSGELVRTPARKLKKDLDQHPTPNFPAIDLNKYLDIWKTHHGKSMISVSTQRGCPYTCKWCSTAVYGQSYRRRSPTAVADELQMLRDTYNPDAVWFVDDVFTVSHKWLSEFRDVLKERKINLPFECITRADRMNTEVIQMLKESGCFRVWIGAESGSQRILDAMDRRVQAEQVREMIIECKKAGIETGTFIMLGYPGETREDINATVNHLKTSNPDHFTITIAYPIKGTSLFEEVDALQTHKIDWRKQTDRERDFKRSYSRKYYDYAVSMVVNEVSFSKLKTGNGSVVRRFKHLVKAQGSKLMMELTK